jgi:hypothetical protein
MFDPVAPAQIFAGLDGLGTARDMIIAVIDR